MIKRLSLLLAFAVACSGSETVPDPGPGPGGGPDGPGPGAETTAPEAELPALSIEDLMAAAKSEALVPSPAEMQKALNDAGIEGQLADLVPDRDNMKMDVPNTDQAAVRTGVVLADLLLTLKAAPKDKLVSHLEKIKTGMTQLGGGEDIPATIDDLSARIQNDAVSRDDLVKELDELSGVMIPEIEYEAGEQVVPLIQAGSWLEGANLIASSMEAAGNYAGATDLLKQPSVVSYFQDYVATEGASKAPSDVIEQLKKTLDTLAEVSAKETLAEEDVKTVKQATSAVLDLL